MPDSGESDRNLTGERAPRFHASFDLSSFGDPGSNTEGTPALLRSTTSVFQHRA